MGDNISAEQIRAAMARSLHSMQLETFPPPFQENSLDRAPGFQCPKIFVPVGARQKPTHAPLTHTTRRTPSFRAQLSGQVR